MKCFVVLFAVAALASADIGLGYHYQVPQTSYGVPNYQTSSSSSGSLSQGTQDSSAGSHFQSSSQPQYQSGGSYQTGGAAYQSAGAYQGYQGNKAASGNAYQQPIQTYQPSSAGYQTSSSAGYQTSGGNAGYQAGTGSVGYSAQSTASVAQPAYQAVSNVQANRYVEKSSEASSSYQQYYQQQVQQQPPQVFKHFYVHAAPEEPEAPKFRQPLVLPPPQKHYKIIFVKTPTPPAPAPQLIPLQPQNEEKTIVYVLVKKPEEAGEVVIPKAVPTPPSKPEVYFIKYTGKQGSQAVINNLVSNINTNTGSGQAGASIVDGALSDSGASSGGFVSGGASSGGSFSVSEGASAGHQSGASQTVTSGSEGGYSTGGSFQQQDSSSTVGASQGLPHTSYGPPSFRA